MEYVRKCNVCGKIYCYTDEDIEESRRNAKLSMVSAIGGMASAIGGNLFTTALSNNQTQNYSDKVRDFSQCPNCGSRNTDILPFEDTSEEHQIEETKQDLLDFGVFTKDELNKMSDEEIKAAFVEFIENGI